eukprot:c5366_g1_i2.p1 GENE.c5366_g1_i2~~c5366_g1_i2.p1  ORF type:complete len:202 (-),score=50.34 c5366_g1_i2:134-739(-)
MSLKFASQFALATQGTEPSDFDVLESVLELNDQQWNQFISQFPSTLGAPSGGTLENILDIHDPDNSASHPEQTTTIGCDATSLPFPLIPIIPSNLSPDTTQAFENLRQAISLCLACAISNQRVLEFVSEAVGRKIEATTKSHPPPPPETSKSVESSKTAQGLAATFSRLGKLKEEKDEMLRSWREEKQNLEGQTNALVDKV